MPTKVTQLTLGWVLCVCVCVCVCVCACTLSCVQLFCDTMDCSPPAPLSMEFPVKTTVGCHFLLWGIFLTQGSNPHLLHWQAGSLPLAPPRKGELVTPQGFLTTTRGRKEPERNHQLPQGTVGGKGCTQRTERGGQSAWRGGQGQEGAHRQN